MFRRRSTTLPKDPSFPADLTKLGYTILPNDTIRSTSPPHHEFHYFISKSPRVLLLHRCAFNTALRTHLSHRFTLANLHPTPLSSSHIVPDPTQTPHIPILTTPNLRTAPRILLYVGESTQDLGILAYRTLCRSRIASGSVLDFVAAARERAAVASSAKFPFSPSASLDQPTTTATDDNLAIIIANPGQLLYHRLTSTALSPLSWDALPLPSGVDGRIRVDEVRNRVPGHRDEKEHVASVMEFLAREMGEGAKVDVVGVGDGAEVVVGYLRENWGRWGGRVGGCVVGVGWVWEGVGVGGGGVGEEEEKEGGFADFWAKHARAYLLHPSPAGTPLQGRDRFGCNCYSAGEEAHVECIMQAAHGSMLDFLQLGWGAVEGYEERHVVVVEEEQEEDGGEDQEREGWGEGISVSRVEGLV